MVSPDMRASDSPNNDLTQALSRSTSINLGKGGNKPVVI